MTNISALNGTSPSPAGKTEREKLGEVARQFEAIFLRQMLSTARQTSFDKDGLFSGQAMDTFRQMQDERFADIAASRGAFGMAQMLEAHLARHISDEGGK